MNIKIVNKSNNPLPEYQSIGAAGMDIRAFLAEKIILKPGNVYLVPTGLFMEIPEGYELQIRARSGLALKNKIGLLNGIGTIDSDYRGEIKVILFNFGDDDFEINSGDRIAQIVLNKFEKISFTLENNLSETKRGEGGFGSSGV